MIINLSKSTFIKGCQCPKALYLHKYFPGLKDEISLMQQAVFNRGTEVGLLAQQLFPGGINASPDLPNNYEGSIAYTTELIAGECPIIYEAGFSFDGVTCFVDILVREEKGWHAYEVKSSTNLSNVYHLDAALQYHVMRGSGLSLSGIDIITIDNRYVRQGQLDIQALFRSFPVDKHALRLQGFVADKIAELKGVLSRPGVPETDIGPHCTDPYSCDFMGHCWKDIPSDSVFDLAGLTGRKKWDLYNRGILRMVDIPGDYPLNPSQQLQLEAARSGKSTWKRKELDEFIQTLHYPLFFLDFESFQPAVPLFDRSRPYQQIPFQYSLHIMQDEHAELLHKEFIAGAGPDPRPGFADRLITDLGVEGDIVVYNKAFEKRILKDIARDVPGYDERMEGIVSRMKDLMEPFRRKLVYLPEMKGSYSIKSVFPALFPGSGYADLDISDGGSASLAYESLLDQEDPDVIAKTRRQLSEYCSLDTLAMVKIWERVRDL